MDFFENEVPKHKKKTNSDISKSNAKSNHKHQYAECILKLPLTKKSKDLFCHFSSYCTICGKIGQQIEDGYVLEQRKLGLRNDQICEKFKDNVPIFELGTAWENFVEINKPED